MGKKKKILMSREEGEKIRGKARNFPPWISNNRVRTSANVTLYYPFPSSSSIIAAKGL